MHFGGFNVGALAGFLLFNLQVFNGRKIFLGDSGSMLIGLLGLNWPTWRTRPFRPACASG